MSTYFLAAKKLVLDEIWSCGDFSWWRTGNVFQQLVYSLPHGIDASCVGGCDILPILSLAACPEMELALDPGPVALRAWKEHTETEFSLRCSPVKWDGLDIFAREEQRTIMGSLLWTMKGAEKIPFLLSADQAFPWTQARKDDTVNIIFPSNVAYSIS